MFPEALLLHYLDDLDSKMECMRALVDKDRQVEGDWTTYSPSLERVVLKKLKYLSEAPGAPEDAAPPEPPPAHDPPSRKPKPPEPGTPSLFGEKLGQALRGPR